MTLDQRNPLAAGALADDIEQHGRALLAMAARLRGEAPGAAATDDEMISVGAVARALRISKAAARMQMVRSGYAAKVGGLWHVPRSAVSTLYRERNVSVPQRNVSLSIAPKPPMFPVTETQ